MCSVKCQLFFGVFTLFVAVGNVLSQDALALDGCRFPGAPAHSSVSFSNTTSGESVEAVPTGGSLGAGGGLLEPGTVAQYQCERGFELLGPARRICDEGQWLPEGIPFCVLNVAAGKAPMQISTEGGGIPQRAIDGSTSAFFSADTCTLTKPERVPWWYVNLLEPYMVQLVRLDFGKACCGANKPATIVVRVGNNRPDLGTNPICNRFTGALEEGQPLFLPCNPPMPGAFVSVHLEVPTSSQLSICEAFVYTDQALPIERCPQFRDQPPGSTATYNGKCYIFYNRQPLRFREALAFCRARGGTLVDESNPALQGFVSWELWRRHRSDTSSQYWMGAVRDQQDRNNWKWLNGDDVTVSFWNLPGGEEDCARYDGSKGWLWSDTNCNTNLNYICQHQPKACGRPEQPPNSTMVAEGGFAVGESVQYSCDDGHLLVGPASRSCLDTGFYNEFPPVCKRIQCGLPASILHGGFTLVNRTVGYLSTVVYSCVEGYEMAGRAQLTCDIDERWNGPPPRCDPVHCEPLGLLENGIADGVDNVYESTVAFSCLRGYKLQGAALLTCLSSGQWDNPPPICKAEDLTTLAPPVTQYKPPRISPTLRQRPTRPRPFSTQIPRQTSPPYVLQPEIEKEDELPPKRTVRPIITQGSFGVTTKEQKNHAPISSKDKINNIIVAAHPQDNEIANNANIRPAQSPNVNVPLSVEGDRSTTLGARLNLGAIIALGAFGGFVFLAAVITTIVILVRRNQSAKHYRHRASPDCNTVASFDSSSSESRNGLNRYYRQAWENLHESAGSKTGLKIAPSPPAGPGNHSPLRRKETLDEPYRRSAPEGVRDGSEMVVADVYPKSEKKRHHHHHHHHNGEPRIERTGHKETRDWREPHLVANSRREHREHSHNNKGRY